MASARPSTYRKSGGQFNDIDVTLVDYRFTDCLPGETEPRTYTRKDGSTYSLLYGVLSLLKDGETQPMTRLMIAGEADDYDISDDEHTITPNHPKTTISVASEWGCFWNSLSHPIDGSTGFDETRFSETEINYQPALGARIRLAEVPRIGPDGKVMMRKGKKGTKYENTNFNQTNLVVSHYFGQEERQSATPTTRAARKPNGRAVETSVDEISAEAEATLLSILEKAPDHKIAKQRLSVAVLHEIYKAPTREAQRKLIGSDAWLDKGVAKGLWMFDRTSKNPVIELLS